MSMFGLLAPFSRLLKVKDVDIYDTIFRLHSKLSVLVFLAFSALVSANEFFGKPMDCVGSDMHQVDPYFNNYCWVNGTFTVNSPSKFEVYRLNNCFYFYIFFFNLFRSRSHWFE